MKRTSIPACFVLVFAALCALAQPALAEQAASAQSAQSDGIDPSKLTLEQIAAIDSPQALYQLVEAYQASEDMQHMAWTLGRLSHLFPGSGEIKLALAAAYSNMGDKSKAYDTLLRMQQQGFGYNLTDDYRFKKVADTKVWEYAVANLRANLKPFGEGKVAFGLPKGDHLFESIAWDPTRKQFLIGSVREDKIYLADKNGKLSEFISSNADNGLWSVYAMAVDAPRDALYVASTASVYSKDFKQDDFGKAGVFKFQLSTGKLIDKYLLPNPPGVQTLSSITVSKKGQVFAADGIRNIIYRLDGKTLKPLVENPKLTSVRGLAASDDGKTLYFSDFTFGIFGADLTTGKGFDVRYDPATLVLSGIEGLYYYDGTLIAIEPGMAPKRVMRFTLGKEGRSIVKVMPIDAANQAFELPTSGTMVDDKLYFLANSRKGYYDKYGVPKDDEATKSVEVFQSNARFAWNEAGITPKLSELPLADPNKGPAMLATPPKSFEEQAKEHRAQKKPVSAKPTPPKKDGDSGNR